MCQVDIDQTANSELWNSVGHQIVCKCLLSLKWNCFPLVYKVIEVCILHNIQAAVCSLTDPDLPLLFVCLSVCICFFMGPSVVIHIKGRFADSCN